MLPLVRDLTGILKLNADELLDTFSDSFSSYRREQMYLDKNDLVLEYEIPGISKTEIEATISDDNVLYLKSTNKRWSGDTVRINKAYNASDANVLIKDGLLTIRIPLAKAKACKKLDIKGD